MDALYNWTQPGIVRYSRSIVGDGSLGFLPSSLYSRDNKPLLANRIRSQIKGEAVNLANMLGEYKQAADLFGSAAEKLYRLTMAVRKRDPRILIFDYYSPRGRLRKKLTRRARKDLSGAYLEYMYGVKPLMQDIHQAMLDMKHRLQDRPACLELDARIAENYTWTTKWYCPVNSLQDGRKTFIERRVDKAKSLVLLKNDVLLNSLGAYGFTNPASLAWELLPFSFVIDWWLSVGDVLQSLDNCLYVQSALIQYVNKYDFKCLSEIYGSGAYYVLNEYNRTAPLSLSSVSTLLYKPSLSVTHVFNGLALLGQLGK
jgi:hypothetical protein